MASLAHPLISALLAVVDRMGALTTQVSEYRELSDAELREVARLSASLQRAAETQGAVVAGEVAHRSRSELGSGGLAQREGFRTAEEFVRVTTGSTIRDAAAAVRVGRLLESVGHEGAVDLVAGSGNEGVTGDGAVAASEPWLAHVARAVAAGELSVGGAESISRGLGQPSALVTQAQLAEAVRRLCLEASVLDADRLYRRARQLRDELELEVDGAAVAERESERRAARNLALYRRQDGMGRLVWTLDPETLARVGELFDRATSPRRGGPRFSANSDGLADRIASDSRTTGQLASDVFEHLLAAGADADSSELLGTGAASVRVLVTRRALQSRAGHARIEGQAGPVSIETAERLACGGSTIAITFDDHGQPLNVGREQRLYTRVQRIALAARDGGCRWPGCERPPSWTEAHHIRFWARDAGNTDVADGVLLCRHHHLLLHNNHWEVERNGAEYWLIPPPSIDPEQRRRRMRSTSLAMADLRRELRRDALGERDAARQRSASDDRSRVTRALTDDREFAR
ncbi:HNH endonuclease signature motif containing protein [Parafrigoribacterium soli]|uniref:HNH endonuclease signature motif containing protein n=1 Tax=Parafrigoribacterium soli TaxID=3144663 RepID=UPI0032ED3D0C